MFEKAGKRETFAQLIHHRITPAILATNRLRIHASAAAPPRTAPAAPTELSTTASRKRRTRRGTRPTGGQPALPAKLARVLHHTEQELWDACTHTSSADMWEEARAIASRILVAAPAE